MKKILVLASSGYDSTYNIIRNLELGNEVYPFYINCNIGIMKRKAEIYSLNKIIDKLVFNHLKPLIVSNEYNFGTFPAHFSGQPIAWIIAAYQEVLSLKARGIIIDEVQISYISKDEALGYLNELKEVFTSFFKLVQPYPKKEINIPELSFPLIKIYKNYILEYLSEEYPEIFELCWTCDDPIYDPKTKKYSMCGKCLPCDHFKERTSFLYYDSHNVKYGKLLDVKESKEQDDVKLSDIVKRVKQRRKTTTSKKTKK
jgi:7-cyano-7-deazaguanine synthase in queuosine biosynthesis